MLEKLRFSTFVFSQKMRFLLELTREGGVQMCNETWMVSEVRERVERRKA